MSHRMSKAARIAPISALPCASLTNVCGVSHRRQPPRRTQGSGAGGLPASMPESTVRFTTGTGKNSPSVVRMFSEMLLSGRVRSEEKEKQYLEIICRESERLSALIESLPKISAPICNGVRLELMPSPMACNRWPQ